MYLATALTTADCIVCIGGKREKAIISPLFFFASFPFVYVYTMHVITPCRSQTRRLTGFRTEKYQITANK